MTWADLRQYFQTWSSLHTFRERHPEDAKDPRGDISERFWLDLKEGTERDLGKSVGEEGQVDVEWPLALLLVKKA